MSASEKLREFESPLNIERVMGALPQLIAVVEAAEEFNFPQVTGQSWQNMSTALTALSEALERK